MSNKTKRPDIPPERLSEGIKLCFQNYLRLRNDALLLKNKQRFLSALPFLIFAKEELTKAMLLFENYRKQESVSGKRLENLFESHKFRLREFTKFLHSEGNGVNKKDVERYLTSEYYLADKEHREDSIYVNWTEQGWQEPNKFFFTRNAGMQDLFTQQRIEFIEKEIDIVLKFLIQINDFKKICDSSEK